LRVRRKSRAAVLSAQSCKAPRQLSLSRRGLSDRLQSSSTNERYVGSLCLSRFFGLDGSFRG
jgi:hypothetical protein